jgi:hypothetical protein
MPVGNRNPHTVGWLVCWLVLAAVLLVYESRQDIPNGRVMTRSNSCCLYTKFVSLFGVVLIPALRVDPDPFSQEKQRPDVD